MPRFYLEELDLVRGKQAFYQLFRNDDCAFEEFCSEIETNGRYLSELKMIFAYMEMVANLRLLPKTKMRDLTPRNDTVKEYELKTKHLRVYFIHQEQTGKVVILGGFKNTQLNDLKRFRAIKSEYLNSF